MQVAVGPTVPKGFLPVYSVDTKAEAMELVVATCSRDRNGNYWNRGLAEARLKEPTSMVEIDKQLASLDVFSDQLDRVHDLLKDRGRCKCKPVRRTRG